MIIKKFIAPTMAEALAKVKNDLGDEAVILKTRMNRPNGPKSGKKGSPADGKNVEITAAVETDNRSRFEMPSQAEDRELKILFDTSADAGHLKSEVEQPQLLPSERLSSLVEEVALLKKTIEQQVLRQVPQSFLGNFSAAMIEIGRQLIGRNFSEELTFSILARLANTEGALELSGTELRAQIRQLLVALIPPAEPIKLNPSGKTVVMFIGPTGSGKSSAIARTATQHKIKSGGKVAIITTDNFRADSNQQIKSFCRILGCPCGIVYTPEELALAIKSQNEGLLLVDTSGINPNCPGDIEEVEQYVQAAGADEIHLVTPAATPAGDIKALLNASRSIEIDRIFVTKLDETVAPGGIITAALNTGLKFSYASRSREISGDLNLVNPESLADALLAVANQPTVEPEFELEAVGIWQ